ncbi:MAG TPA: PAS domain-containing protein [Fibrobacteria bacterium]|nr:PAS domain-containing protein [Fibrobacteria bacterium]HOX53720.1 PAS domain-containing protein [Fibrobacteria bacterium]
MKTNSPPILGAEEYQILVEQSPILIWRADLSMGCDYFNERWLAFTGRSMAQELGNGWAEGVHPEDFQRCLEIYTTHFRDCRAFEMEYRLKRADGQYRWIFDRGAPYFDKDGGFRGFIGSCVDVTERIEAQEALKRRHEEELKELGGFLPICCYCKKIRNDSNYWEQIESFVSRHSSAVFSHGICPTCRDKVMDEIENARRDDSA